MTERQGGARYAIKGGDAGRARLEMMARFKAPVTRALLERIGVPRGARCLDLGCGSGHVTRLLAELAGQGGHVLGIDLDERVIEIDRTDARARGLTNVEFRVQDIADLAHEGFDLAYTGLVLMHLPRPEEAIAAIVRALRPGGVFVSEDDDLRTCFCVPQRDAFERAARLQHDAIERRNGWRCTYLRLPALLREAGLADVGLSLSQSVWTDAATKTILPISLALMADAIIGEGLATRDEIDALLSELDALAEDPATLCAAPRTHQAWGRKR